MYNIYNITTLIIAVMQQNLTKQIAYQLQMEIKKSKLVNLSILNTIGRNIAKQFEMK